MNVLNNATGIRPLTAEEEAEQNQPKPYTPESDTERIAELESELTATKILLGLEE